MSSNLALATTRTIQPKHGGPTRPEAGHLCLCGEHRPEEQVLVTTATMELWEIARFVAVEGDPDPLTLRALAGAGFSYLADIRSKQAEVPAAEPQLAASLERLFRDF